MLSSGFPALGGTYILARGGAADTLIGTGELVLVAIAAAVIGGCSLFGGRGSPWAALIGAAVLTTLIMGLNIANRGANLQLILEGAILVAAVAVDAVMRRRLITRQAFTRTAHGATPTAGG
jgi:D-xylose transport system permease protein